VWAVDTWGCLRPGLVLRDLAHKTQCTVALVCSICTSVTCSSPRPLLAKLLQCHCYFSNELDSIAETLTLPSPLSGKQSLSPQMLHGSLLHLLCFNVTSSEWPSLIIMFKIVPHHTHHFWHHSWWTFLHSIYLHLVLFCKYLLSCSLLFSSTRLEVSKSKSFSSLPVNDV
jgi:hypothetical protein